MTRLRTRARYVKRHEETERQILARIIYAAEARKRDAHFRVVVKPAPGVWYDFADPETKAFGQCMLNEDGSWHQEPRGTNPVLLAYCPPVNSRPSMKEEWDAIGRLAYSLSGLTVHARKGDLGKQCLVQRITKKGVFTGTIKAMKPKGVAECLYAVCLNGLSRRQMEKLAGFLKRLK
jgi:hypothetical protein